jgi:hypothetical protein
LRADSVALAVSSVSEHPDATQPNVRAPPNTRPKSLFFIVFSTS